MHLSIKNSIHDCSLAEKTFLKEAGVMNFYRGLSWISLLDETCFDEQTKLMLFFFYDDLTERPIACLPMKSEMNKLYHLFAQKCLTPLTNFYTCDYGISSVSLEIDYYQLTKVLMDYFVVSEFDLMTLDSCLEPQLIEEMVARSQEKMVIHESYTHFIQRYDIFRDRKSLLIDQLPSKLAHTLTRKLKKVKNDFEMKVHFYEGETVKEGLMAYETVYQKAWQKPEPFPDFIPRFVKDTNEDGRLLISVLTFNGQPVAAQLWLEWKPGVFAIYKLAYDQDFQRYSPGSLLLHYSFDYVLGHKNVKEIDFGRGDDPYKSDWLPIARQAYGLEIYKPSFTWRLIFAVKKIYRLFKRS